MFHLTTYLFQEELFGPVLAVTKFSEDSKHCISKRYSIRSTKWIWTNDLSRAHKFARDVESGMVSINEYPITFPQTAFTGWKHSGIGISNQGCSQLLHESEERQRKAVIS